jgi:hypothetical protein
MMHWYREPKRVKLMEHLEAGIDFVFSSDGFGESDLRNLKAAVPISLAKRLTLGVATAGDARKVLVIALQGSPDPEWLRNPEPWAGIFVLPDHRPHREDALQAIFIINRSVKNGVRGQRPIRMGIVHRFVLDMRTSPPFFTKLGKRASVSRQRLVDFKTNISTRAG